jgi:rhodanese-related sulfurtransferase
MSIIINKLKEVRINYLILFLEEIGYMRNVFFLFLFSGFISCKGQADSLRLGAADFNMGINGVNVQVLDVRTAGEFKTGHIKNALQADWNNKEQFNERIKYVDKDKPVYIYCLAGGRSAAAADWMRKNGYNNVVELTGGINAWKKAEKPLEGVIEEKQMTIEDYWAKILKDKTVLVDFGAKWCPPCVKMEPVMDELQKTKDLDFILVKIDGGVHTDVMNALNTEPIPFFIVYKNGKEVWRKPGIVTKEELLAQIK